MAHAWVERLLDELHRQHRPVAGGWPGTMSEARRHVATRLVSEADLGRTLTKELRDDLAKRVYALAKSTWLSKASSTPQI